jgi:hypothetical protein
MPIARLLNGSAFSPADITILSKAFEDTLRMLRLVDRADPAVEIIAKKIFELAQQGERNPVRLRQGALNSLGG